MKLSHVFKDAGYSKKISDSISFEEKQKRSYLYLCGILAVPILIVFGFVESEPLLSYVDFSSAVYYSVLLLYYRSKKDCSFFYRVAIASTFILFIFYATYSGADGNGILWCYLFPLISFYLLPQREALIWVHLFFLLLCGMIYFPELFNTYHYHNQQGTEFIVSLSMVTVLSYALEKLKENYHKRLIEKNKELSTALENIKTLTGLLPICSWCKKIRDDKGYWRDVENYISQHSQVSFSHGCCDECMQKYFPDTYKKVLENRLQKQH